MTAGQCPHCGQFVAHVTAHPTQDTLGRITGICRRHGAIEAIGDWWWEDFFPEEPLSSD